MWIPLKKVFGIPSQSEREYARPERLADVMALIQVLALHKYAERSAGGLERELQGPARSAKSESESWKFIAKEHPEFFRVLVDGEEKNDVSLVARHVLTRKEVKVGEKVEWLRDQLSPEFVGTLLDAAVDIHDRQVRRSERWSYLVPIWVALILGIFGLIGALVRILLG
jgi:hypothetical protein